jgi:hypothetical protein
MRLRDESSWTRFKRGISHDFQQGVHQLSPVGARALQWLGEAGKRRLTRLRALSWHAFPLPLNVVFLLIGTGLLLLIIIKVPQGTGLGPVLGAWIGAGLAYLFTRRQRLEEEQRRRRALATILLSEIQVLYDILKDIHHAFFLKAFHKATIEPFPVTIEPFHTAQTWPQPPLHPCGLKPTVSWPQVYVSVRDD